MAIQMTIDWDELHKYRAELMASVPSDFVPLNLYETLEYYLINASEEGWTDEEKEKFVATAIGIGDVLERMFSVANAIPCCIRRDG